MSSLVQHAYVNFDKITYNVNEKFGYFSAKVANTRYKLSGVLSTETLYYKEVYHEVLRVRLSIPESYKDVNYSRSIFQADVDACTEVSEGSVASIFTRAFVEPLYKLANYKIVKCPYAINFIYLITNLTISDTFLPPCPFGVKFKIDYKMFGGIREYKEMVNVFNLFLVRKI